MATKTGTAGDDCLYGGGPDTLVYQARDQGLLDPLRPLLVLPEVTDESKWLGGLDGLFADNDHQYAIGFMAYKSNTVYVNRDVAAQPPAGPNQAGASA